MAKGITKAENTAAFFVAAVAGGGSAGIRTDQEFPPSERVFYLRTENGEVILTENGNALVTEQSAT